MTKLIIDWCGDILLIGWTSLMIAVAVLAARSIAATVRRRALRPRGAVSQPRQRQTTTTAARRDGLARR
jgi:hypothetical protein